MNPTTKCKYFNKWWYNEGQFKLSPHKPISLHFFTYMINCLLACYRHETSCSFDYTHINQNWNLSLFIYIVSTTFFYEHNNLNRSQDLYLSPKFHHVTEIPCLVNYLAYDRSRTHQPVIWALKNVYLLKDIDFILIKNIYNFVTANILCTVEIAWSINNSLVMWHRTGKTKDIYVNINNSIITQIWCFHVIAWWWHLIKFDNENCISTR